MRPSLLRASGASPLRIARALRAGLAASLLAFGAVPAPSAGAQDATSPSPASMRRSASPAPAPELAPEQVVGIVLAAFAHVSHDETGLEVAYAFTAPANRAVIGSVERFVDVVRDGSYRPLLGHRRAVRSEIKVDGDRATQRVLVTTGAGDRVVYTFTLARQLDGEYRGCWMTERVTREPPSSLAAPQATE